MIKYICDRCGKEIKKDKYIIQYGCLPDEDGRISAEGASFNIVCNTTNPKSYCINCIREIENFTNTKNYKKNTMTQIDNILIPEEMLNQIYPIGSIYCFNHPNIGIWKYDNNLKVLIRKK